MTQVHFQSELKTRINEKLVTLCQETSARVGGRREGEREEGGRGFEGVKTIHPKQCTDKESLILLSVWPQQLTATVTWNSFDARHPTLERHLGSL